MPGAIEGIINVFDVDPDTFKVDMEKMLEDINQYGLFPMRILKSISRKKFSMRSTGNI